MISRREFILSICSVVMIPLSVRSFPRKVDKLDVSHLKVQIPRLIFFPECAPSKRKNPLAYCLEKRVIVNTLSFDLSRSTVLVDFSNGKTQKFPAAKSFLSEGKKSLRTRVAIKRLASWLLAGLQDVGGGLSRRDFELLQQQRVLESVTLEALFNLLKVTKLKPNRLITWDTKLTRFILK